jgi:hypothetical protein
VHETDTGLGGGGVDILPILPLQFEWKSAVNINRVGILRIRKEQISHKQ